MISHMSIGCCGDTENGNHEQVHHRQTIQVIWDIYDRDRFVFMKIAKEIVSESVGKITWQPKPTKERDTRWLTNGRSAQNILTGYYIQDADGTPFWVLLAQRLIYIYKESDWRVKRLKAFIAWILMPEMIFGLWMEAEAVQCFMEHYFWHAQCGELADRPGFRSLEYIFEVLDHVMPRWHKALKNPASAFPNTMKHIKDEMEDKGLDEMAEMKKAQLVEGIKCAHDEMAKMYKDFFMAPWVFTIFTCPKRGAIVLRVILTLIQEAGVDINGEYDDAGHLIDKDFTFDLRRAPQVPCSTYNAYHAKLKEDKQLAHYFQMFGFLKSSCRTELIMFSRERGVIRDPESKTKLHQFAKVYPNLFDCLWSQLALHPSSSRITEGFHGIERHAFNFQTHHGFTDGRGRYLLLQEYFNRKRRRDAVKSKAEEDGRKLKCTPKHNDRGYTLVMAGEQCVDTAEEYKPKALRDRISSDFLEENTITAINKRGTTAQQKKHVEKLVQHADGQRKKKLRSDKYKDVSLAEYIANAQKMKMDYDKLWQDSDHLDDLKKIEALMKKAHWQKAKVEDGLYEDIERVFPDFWKLYTKELKRTKGANAVPRKGALLEFKGSYKTSLMMFCKHVVAISKGETPNNISTKTRQREMQRAGITEELVLMEFVKFDKCESLKKKEREETEKYQLINELIDSNGTEVASEYIGPNKGIDAIERHAITYHHPSATDGDDHLVNFDEL